MTAAPFVVRGTLEPRTPPRALAWVHVAILATIASAVFGVLTFLVFYLAPERLSGVLGISCVRGDHCLHGLPVWAQWSLWTTATALLVALLGRGVWVFAAAVRSSRRARRLVLMVGRPAGVPGPATGDGAAQTLREVEDEGVVACTVGFFRPLILVSSGLRNSLSFDEFEAVVAHERAHASGRDNLLLLAGRVIDRTLFFTPGVREAYKGLCRSLEVAADARAAESTGDPLLVAGSLSRVARLSLVQTGPQALTPRLAGAFFGQDDLVITRLQRLITERPPKPSRTRLLGAAVALVFIISILGSSGYLVAGQNLGSESEAAVCYTGVDH